MRRLIWLPVAGFLLIAGAAVAAAAPSAINRAQEVLVAVGASPAATETEVLQPAGRHADGLLGEVLANLVEDGTITQAQADAILGGVQTELEARRAEFEALRQQWEETREKIYAFLKDGVITQAEIDTLPADNPLREAFDSIAEDGQITLDQLQQFMPFKGGRGGPAGPGGPGFGHHFWGFDAAPDTDDSEEAVP